MPAIPGALMGTALFALPESPRQGIGAGRCWGGRVVEVARGGAGRCWGGRVEEVDRGEAFGADKGRRR